MINGRVIRMAKKMHIILEINDDVLEAKMSVDGKMYVDYPHVHHLLIDILKEIESFETENDEKCQ